MGITSLQVCMDSSDWSSLQGAISGDNTGLMDSPQVATPNGDNDILTCSRPLMERRLRPNHEQALKCPRCESTHTKFCYYNNYSLTQPRYFCKTCRRYWTKGGTLRNIPVGGGCRKNKKVSSSSKKASSSSSDQNSLHRPSPSSLSSPLTLDRSNFLNRNRDQDQTVALHLAFPEQLQFSSIHGGGLFNPANTGFFFENMSSNPVEYMGSKYDHAFMGNTTTTTNNNSNDNNGMQNPSDNYFGYNNNNNNPFGLMSCFENGICNPGVGATNNLVESCQRLMLPYDNENHHYQLDQNHEVADVKPNAKILSLEWHDCNSGIKDSFGYNLGSWNGLMAGYGSSATNTPLV